MDLSFKEAGKQAALIKLGIFGPEEGKRVARSVKPYIVPLSERTPAYTEFMGNEGMGSGMSMSAAKQVAPRPEMLEEYKQVLPQRFHNTGILHARPPVEEQLKPLGYDYPSAPPAEKKMLLQLGIAHEADELHAMKSPIDRAFKEETMHWKPEVIMREHNRIKGLPPEFSGLVDLHKKMRTQPMLPGVSGMPAEGAILKAHGIDYATSPRLSRHAIRRLGDLMKNFRY